MECAMTSLFEKIRQFGLEEKKTFQGDLGLVGIASTAYSILKKYRQHCRLYKLEHLIFFV